MRAALLLAHNEHNDESCGAQEDQAGQSGQDRFQGDAPVPVPVPFAAPFAHAANRTLHRVRYRTPKIRRRDGGRLRALVVRTLAIDALTAKAVLRLGFLAHLTVALAVLGTAVAHIEVAWAELVGAVGRATRQIRALRRRALLCDFD